MRSDKRKQKKRHKLTMPQINRIPIRRVLEEMHTIYMLYIYSHLISPSSTRFITKTRWDVQTNNPIFNIR